LLALVNDVLDISKIEAGQFEMAGELFELDRSIEQVLALCAPQAEAKHLKLRVQLEEVLGAAVGDERRFEQILLNLLSNAIKFTEAGEVTLTAGLLENCRLPGDSAAHEAVRVCVSDTGIGIKAEDMHKLFQPFRQIDSGLTRKHEGTGLGLVICRRLAQLMGGDIGVESEPGKGSVFSLTLPLSRRDTT
jgi:signal transduction histidine kinase